MKFQIFFGFILLCLISCTSTQRSMKSDQSQSTDKSTSQSRAVQSESPYSPELFKPVDGNMVNQPQPDKIDLADFYFSKKQYDESFNIYSEALLDNTSANINTERWLQSAIRSIVVAVRIKKDQSLALELVSALFDSKAIPASHKVNARYWQRSLKNWRNEDDANSYSHLKTSKVLVQTEKQLNEMQSAKKPKEYFLIDRLRISAMLEYLKTQGKLTDKEMEQFYSLAELNSTRLNEIESSGGPVLRTY